jgi:uncharacterized protein DUF3313
MKRSTLALLAVPFLISGFALARGIPDVTEDGLVRVPSSGRYSIVYRAPDVSFARYRRVMLDRTGVAFKRTWERDNMRMKHEDIEELRQQAAESFRDELMMEIVRRGGFMLTDVAAPDVLRIRPYIVRLDIAAPTAGTIQSMSTYVRSSGSMSLVVELHDAASGAIIARIIHNEPSREFGNLVRADQIFNSAEARGAFIKGAELTHEAINYAQAERAPPTVVPQ